MKRSAFFPLAVVLALACTLPARVESDEPAAPPNLLMDVSAALVDAAMRQKVDRTEDFAEVLLETPTTGTRHTVGAVHAELVPDPTHAALDVVLNASSEAQGVACRAHARIYTTTTVGFEVRSRIRLDAHGFRGCRGPGGAKAIICLVGTTDREGATDGAVAGLARIGFRHNKEELEALVARRTVPQASAAQEAELMPVLAKAQQNLENGLGWARQAKLNVESLQFSTSATHVHARLRLASTRLPWPGKAPPAPADADLGLRVHQSFFNELARATLGGKTYSPREVIALAERLTAPLLRDGRKDADLTTALKAFEKLLEGLAGKAITLTLAQDDPVTITFTPEALTVEAHLAAIHVEGVAFPGMRIQAAYRFEHSVEGVQLLRQGPIQVRPEDPAAPNKGAIVSALLRPVLVAVASEILKERFVARDLPQPAGVAALRADLSDGWLSAAWKLRPSRTK